MTQGDLNMIAENLALFLKKHFTLTMENLTKQGYRVQLSISQVGIPPEPTVAEPVRLRKEPELALTDNDTNFLKAMRISP